MKHTVESRKKMSASQKENPTRYWLGKKRDAETRTKISIAKKGKPKTKPPTELERKTRAENMRRAARARIKAVVCLDDEKEFTRTTEAAKFYWLSRETVRNSCYTRKAVRGYSFRYKDELA